MKTFSLTTTIAAFLLLCTHGIQAQTSPICLANAEQFSIPSQYVEGETYTIQIGLPISYSCSNKSYPVLYVTDGDVYFVQTKGIADWLMLGGCSG